MTTTTLDAAAERRKRIEAEHRRRPEAGGWLRLLARALDAAEHPAWTELLPRLPSARDPDAPLLHDAFIAVDRRAARRWVRALLRAAANAPEPGARSLAELDRRALDPVELLAAAASQDDDRLAVIARSAASGTVETVDFAALAVVARLAALPLLRGAAGAVSARVPAGWTRGYCPACGGWPVVAELRGLERTRVLRCGRCATGWERPVLVCAFCDERDHRRQLSFAIEGEEQKRRVDACRACHGYLKTLTTLAPLRPWAVPLDDVASLELDLVAADRGFHRPDAPGHAAALHVVPAGGPLSGTAGGWA